MAFEENLSTFSLEAAADLSASQFHALVVDANGQVALAGAAVRIDGVLQNDPAAAGREAAVAFGGITKMVCGAAVAAGAEVATNAAARAITAVATNPVIGRAITAGGADGDIISVLLRFGTA